MDRPLPDGGRLTLYVRERTFREPIGRLDQVVAYVTLDARGAARQQSNERLTCYMTDPAPFAAAAGLEPDGLPEPFGRVGDIHRFRKA